MDGLRIAAVLVEPVRYGDSRDVFNASTPIILPLKSLAVLNDASLLTIRFVVGVLLL
jgi:hypothetical protein